MTGLERYDPDRSRLQDECDLQRDELLFAFGGTGMPWSVIAREVAKELGRTYAFDMVEERRWTGHVCKERFHLLLTVQVSPLIDVLVREEVAVARMARAGHIPKMKDNPDSAAVVIQSVRAVTNLLRLQFVTSEAERDEVDLEAKVAADLAVLRTMAEQRAEDRLAQERAEP